MASGPSVAPGTPTAAAATTRPGSKVFCKLCLSEQPPEASSELQGCGCRFCTAVSTTSRYRPPNDRNI